MNRSDYRRGMDRRPYRSDLSDEHGASWRRAGWVDAAVKARFGWDLQVVTKSPGQRGFVVQPRRWVVERTFAWLTDCRRLGKDCEVCTETSEAFIYLAMIQLMLKRLAPNPAYRPWNAAHAA